MQKKRDKEKAEKKECKDQCSDENNPSEEQHTQLSEQSQTL